MLFKFASLKTRVQLNTVGKIRENDRRISDSALATFSGSGKYEVAKVKKKKESAY